MKFTDFAISSYDAKQKNNLVETIGDIAQACQDLLLLAPDEIIPEKRYVKYDDIVLFVGSDHKFQWVNVCPYCGLLTVSVRVDDIVGLGALLKEPFEPVNFFHICSDTPALRRYRWRCFFTGELDLSHKNHDR